jgi:hypothetical protein
MSGDRAEAPPSSTEIADRLAATQRRSARTCARQFRALKKRYADRQDIAWWPADFEPRPCSRETVYFYRPGRLLVRTEVLDQVAAVLNVLGVQVCHAERLIAGLVRLTVTSRDPVPVLLDRLQCYGLGLDVVGPDHVFDPTYGAAPWFSGGADSLPTEVLATVPVEGRGPAGKGAGVKIAVFDSGMIAGYNLVPQWPSRVKPAAPTDVEPAPIMLDLFDNHGAFVSAIIGYAAPRACVSVRNVLGEDGTISDADLVTNIQSYLASNSDVRLVNLSLGGTTANGQPPLALPALIGSTPNVVFVASAGNNGGSGNGNSAPFSPASLPEVVGVGALNPDGTTPAPWSNQSWPSTKVWARGVDVVSAFTQGTLELDPKRSYGTGRATWSGTSFSAPYVTAVLCDYVTAQQQLNRPISGPGAVAWLKANYQRHDAQGRPLVAPLP